MSRPRSLRVGDRRGRLRVVAESGARVHVECDCGNMKWVLYSNVVRERTVSCGCYHREKITGPGSSQYVHGKSRSVEHRIWTGMVNRCCNPRNRSYARYGGRGITVCERWRSSFEAFLADMGNRPSGRSIDRIDVNGNYEKANCRWATASEQASNRRPRTVGHGRTARAA